MYHKPNHEPNHKQNHEQNHEQNQDSWTMSQTINHKPGLDPIDHPAKTWVEETDPIFNCLTSLLEGNWSEGSNVFWWINSNVWLWDCSEFLFQYPIAMLRRDLFLVKTFKQHSYILGFVHSVTGSLLSVIISWWWPGERNIKPNISCLTRPASVWSRRTKRVAKSRLSQAIPGVTWLTPDTWCSLHYTISWIISAIYHLNPQARMLRELDISPSSKHGFTTE